MGLFKSLFGGGPSKNDLVRNLAKQRVREMGGDESMVDSLGFIQFAGLPENTIATIVETYSMLKKRGGADQEVLASIEAHRSRMSGSGEMPSPLNLETYIQYRIALEASHGAPISADFLRDATNACRQHFGC